MGREAQTSIRIDQLYLMAMDIYHGYARSHGLSDTALWLLYSLRIYKEPLTQRRLSETWHTSPQTINSALKTLEKRGCVALEPLPGGRRDRMIVLTSQGEKVVQAVIDPLIEAENRSIAQLDETEQTMLLSLTERLINSIGEELGNSEKR